MSTYDDIVPSAVVKKPSPVTLTDPSYKHSIVESAKRPLETIISFIGGSNWYVDYYSQVLRSGEELKPFDRSSLTVYQTYRCIHNFQLKLQGGLTSTDQQSSGRIEQTGTMIIPPYVSLSPNIYDMFIADIGEGVAGLFTITGVNKLSLNAQAAFECNFELVTAMTDGLEKQLNHKTVEDLYFKKDLLMLGENPIIQREEYHGVNRLEELEKEIAQLWLSGNFSYEASTIAVPHQPEPTYDPYVARAMTNLIDYRTHPNYGQVKLYNCDDHRMAKYMDIFTVLAENKKHYLARCFTKAIAVDTRQLKVMALQNTIRFSHMNRVVVPTQSNLDPDNYGWLWSIPQQSKHNLILTPSSVTPPPTTSCCPADPMEPCGPSTLGTSGGTIGSGDIKDNVVDYNQPTDVGMAIPKITNESYVLSMAFYQGDLPNCTLFERKLHQILNGEHLDWQTVSKFCEAYPRWGRLEQYYLTPLLICMIRSALKGVI